MTSRPEDENGVVPRLTATQLIEAIPELAGDTVSIEVENFRQLPGASLSFEDLLDLAAVIDKRVADGASGNVVVQGTDTIEETAYLLDLVHHGGTPVVVTGAMRNPSMAGPDGPANLLAAIRVAASPHSRELGCLVVFDSEIHAARYVSKVHSGSTAAFASPNVGPMGHVVENDVRILTRPTNRLTLAHARSNRSARVALVTMTFGDDGELLRGIGHRFDGLVVAAFGAGHVPAGVVPVLAELAARIPVVLASRTGAGSVLSSTYGFAGSERDLRDRGLISAGFLHPLKARVLLHLLLTNGAVASEVAATFARAGGTANPRRTGSESSEQESDARP